MLRASFPSFSLPTNGAQLSLLLHLTAVDCSSAGMLLSLGGSAASTASSSNSDSSSAAAAPAVDVALDCPRRLLLFTTPSGLLSYQLPKSPAAGVALLLQQDVRNSSFRVCADGSELLPSPGAGGQAMLRLLGGSGGQVSSLLGPAVVFGTRSDAARSARTDIGAAMVVDSLLSCARTQPGAPLQALLQELSTAAAVPASAPAVAVEQQPAGRDAAVGELIQLSITATPGTSASANPHRCMGAVLIHAMAA